MATHGVKTDVGGEPAESTSDSDNRQGQNHHIQGILPGMGCVVSTAKHIA